MKNTGLCILLITFLFTACKSKKDAETTTETQEEKVVFVPAPVFSGDSAFHFIEKQLSFGPRVPGTPPHAKTASWIIAKFKSYGFEVTEQNFKPVNYKGQVIDAKNIIASFNPTAPKRVLLAAHWDSRPMADKDDERQTQPIPGANDGASGVAVLLEIARMIQASPQKPQTGIDIILFDAEDWGAPADFDKDTGEYGGYLLGSDYWSKNLHKPGYSAFYGILLDMVGAKNATFRYDDASIKIAPSVVNNVWNTASQLGYSQFFLKENAGGIVDDHIPVIQNARIPMIDIIDLKTSPANMNTEMFFKDHHTHDDSIQTIDKNTLKAVGQTVLQVVYNESAAVQ